MSAIGTKRTSPSALHMSAIGLTADIAIAAQRKELKGTLMDESPRADQKHKCRRAK